VPVEKNFNDMNDFIHNAGHELKTPLSVIDSNIQLLKESKIYDENMIDELKNETTKLNSLLDSLINLNDI
jgi:signal transduction histidine kinase